MAACFATVGVAAKAVPVFQCEKGMFHPGMADLFKAVVVVSSTAHPIEILRDDWVISIWQLKPIDRLIAVVAGSRCHCKADLGPGTSLLVHVGQIADDYIRTRHECWRFCTGFTLHGWHDH